MSCLNKLAVYNTVESRFRDLMVVGPEAYRKLKRESDKVLLASLGGLKWLIAMVET